MLFRLSIQTIVVAALAACGGQTATQATPPPTEEISPTDVDPPPPSEAAPAPTAEAAPTEAAPAPTAKSAAECAPAAAALRQWIEKLESELRPRWATGIARTDIVSLTETSDYITISKSRIDDMDMVGDEGLLASAPKKGKTALVAIDSDVTWGGAVQALAALTRMGHKRVALLFARPLVEKPPAQYQGHLAKLPGPSDKDREKTMAPLFAECPAIWPELRAHTVGNVSEKDRLNKLIEQGLVDCGCRIDVDLVGAVHWALQFDANTLPTSLIVLELSPKRAKATAVHAKSATWAEAGPALGALAHKHKGGVRLKVR